jgi:hypothetical protein
MTEDWLQLLPKLVAVAATEPQLLERLPKRPAQLEDLSRQLAVDVAKDAAAPWTAASPCAAPAMLV